MKSYRKIYCNIPLRLQYWDYGWNAAYFVTICTKNRKHYFGKISKGKLELSIIGDIANQNWISIPNHFPFVKLGEFVIMPNHVHGIIIIDKVGAQDPSVGAQDLVHPLYQQKNKFGPQSRNLGSIIRGFKVGTTIQARKIDSSYAWQSRFYDHIIRNKNSFHRISNYIIKNPEKW